ncbi:hypothetical protein HYFRA_00006373 [Hymenoscyphus fraxineus]|uniref:Uncharacterized protein n=1 Tax=Hymenoscyphus fraxineus TaxID=746836 RepID=A0A9N9PLC8_9HELO|nr:hypothetical protein HYFRA_00006373 [Hymenoscyphus fraxineus]
MLVPSIFAATAVLCTVVSGIPLEQYNKATVPPLDTVTGADEVSKKVVPEPVPEPVHLQTYNKATVPPLDTATGADGVSKKVVPEPVYLRTYNTATMPPLRTAMEPAQVDVVPLSQKKHNEPIIQESTIRWEPDEVIQKRGPGIGKPSSPVSGKPGTEKPKPKFQWPWSKKPVYNPPIPPKPKNWANAKHEF